MRASDACVLAWMHVKPLRSKAAAHHMLGLAGVEKDSASFPEILQALLLHGCQLGQIALEPSNRCCENHQSVTAARAPTRSEAICAAFCRT